MSKRKPKATKKQTKATKAASPTNIKAVASRQVAEYFVSNKVGEAIDNSIAGHGLEPVSDNAYGAVQLEGGRNWRMDGLINNLYQAMDHHYNLTINEMQDHPDLDDVIDDIFDEYADDIVHTYLDAEDSERYFRFATEDECIECRIDRAEAEGKKEEAARLREIRDEMLEDGTLIRGADKDKASKETKEEEPKKTSALGLLAMTGGALLGAGLAHAALGHSHNVRVATVEPEDVIDGVIDVVGETVSK